MQIAIGNPIGYQSNAGKAAGVFDYLLNDTFATDRATGAVNGTPAEPGPGKRTATDGNSKLSLSGGAAVIATGGVGAGDPGLYYGPVTRAVGLIVTAQVTPSANNAQAGWETNTSGSIGHGWRFAGSNTLQAFVNGSPLTVGVWAANAQNMAIAARASGCYYFLKPNGGNWTLYWISTAGSQTPLLPAVIAESSAGVISCDYIRVYAKRWLPAPLASDGFSIWGTTDGQGHAEGVAGGVGAGGLGELWTANVGTWGASGGAAAASALSGSLGIATVDTGVASVIVTAKVTRSGGNAGIILRYADASNYVYAIHDGTNAKLIKRVAGSETTLVNTAATYAAGAELRVVCDGTSFRLFYNGAAIGSAQTINDAGLASGTKQGFYTSNTGNTFDDFTVYARGAGGEYAVLDGPPVLTNDYLFVVGDSKSTDEWNTAPTWITKLATELGARTGKAYQESTPRFAISGYTMAAMKAYVDANLASVQGTPSKIVINVGVNDISSGVTPNETTWKANLTSIIDSLRTKWASADIYIAKPWRQGLDSEATIIAGYIDAVIATYGAHVFVGHNESVWVKGSDNGAAMLQDSVHYSTLAQTIAAAQWLAAMGY